MYTLRIKLITALGLAFIFFLVTFFTLWDYGPSWDETLHFSRGQVYLNFFLTGKKEYQNLANDRKSFYQLDYQAGDFWFIPSENGGHPPVNGILASLFNYIFYQKLGLITDINSYHLFNILISSFLVFLVTFFAILVPSCDSSSHSLTLPQISLLLTNCASRILGSDRLSNL